MCREGKIYDIFWYCSVQDYFQDIREHYSNPPDLPYVGYLSTSGLKRLVLDEYTLTSRHPCAYHTPHHHHPRACLLHHPPGPTHPLPLTAALHLRLMLL